MKTILFLSSLLLSSALWAESWSVGGKSLEIARCPQQYCLISKACLSDQKTACLALKAMKNKIQSDTGPGGTNPGSGVCQKHHQGSVFVARDEKGNEVAFCLFKDDSFLSLDGLWRW
ncbi:MAG: hypothetical protein LW878_00505 [Proteobacteria bacterium]|jgi:hypothetical protein|nr:hypothetical protein [Pseudomonadota bacterium]